MKYNHGDELPIHFTNLKCSKPVELQGKSNTRLSSPNSHYESDVDNNFIKLNTKSKYTPWVTEATLVALKLSNAVNILLRSPTNKYKLHYDLPTEHDFIQANISDLSDDTNENIIQPNTSS